MLPCFTVTINEATPLPPLALLVRDGMLTPGSVAEIQRLGTPRASTTYWVAAEDRWSAAINVIEVLCHDDMNLDDLEHGFRVRDVSNEQSEDPFFMTLLAMRRSQGDKPGILYCSDEG